MKKKLLAACLSLALCVSLVPAASAAESPSYPSAQTLAENLKSLGLFLGDESGNFDLDRAPTRIEALIMLIRALGEEPQAKAAGKTHPFADVPAWADGYVSWGYAKGYTKGISATEFGSNSPADSRMYLTFLLRALGYTEGEGGDFTYAQPFYLAYQAKILPFAADYVYFNRADAVMTTAAALWAALAGSGKTLADRLVEQGRFTVADFAAQFPQDPFSWEHSLMPLVDKALSNANPTGQTDRKTIQAQAHVITYAVYKPDLDQTRVYAMVGHASREWNAEGGEQSGGSGAGFWTIDFATKTGQVLACESGGDFSDWPVTTEGHNAYADLFTPTLRDAAMAKLNALESSGEVGYQAPTYDQAVAELRASFGYYNERTFDTPECTVFVYDLGGAMHTGTGYITIIYKPGSVKGDGFTFGPPTPGGNYSPLIPQTPDLAELSEDKKTFTYSYHFDEPLISGGRMIRAAGDFVYTVDLPTGAVTENIPQVSEDANTYAASLERFLAENAEDGYVVEKTIEAPLCTLVFSYFPAEDGKRSYFLEAIYKTDVDADVSGSIWHTNEGEVKNISLPITADDGSGLSGGTSVLYCERMPDSMSLSEDGNTFTFVYNECHYGSPYTTVVDLRSGLWDRLAGEG